MLGMRMKPVKIAVPVAVAVYLVPYLSLFLIACGVVDFESL